MGRCRNHAWAYGNAGGTSILLLRSVASCTRLGRFCFFYSVRNWFHFVFGYHELWHVFTAAAAAAQFAAVGVLIANVT